MKKMVVFSMVLLLAMGFASAEFTQTVLDNDWEADRHFPTDGVESVTAFGRDNVARIGLNSSETASGTFQRTEGIKTVGSQNFGNFVEFDLYLDPEWEDQAVRAGFWVVGDDGTGNRDNWFGIVEFVNLEPSISGDSAQGNHTGWRIWDSANGWTNLNTPYEYGEWSTLSIGLDTADEEYDFYVNSEYVGSGPGGQHFISELFLNSYNYGLDEFANLDNGDYAAHWHAGLENPQVKDDCKKGGWQDFGFKNQGQCIKFVNTGK